MKEAIKTLQEAIEAKASIYATYAPNGAFVRCCNLDDLTEIKFKNGKMRKVERNDLTGFTWK